MKGRMKRREGGRARVIEEDSKTDSSPYPTVLLAAVTVSSLERWSHSVAFAGPCSGSSLSSDMHHNHGNLSSRTCFN